MNYRIVRFFPFVMIVVFVASCGGSDIHSNSSHGAATTPDDHSHPGHEHSPKSQASDMKLDNGKRWKMDDHTRSMFNKMVSSFEASDHSSVAGLQESGIQLKEQIHELIRGCTMTGNAHNQLHVFLTGYIPAVETLASTDDLNSGRERALKVKGFLDRYADYFE